MADAPYAVVLAVLNDWPKTIAEAQGQDHQRLEQRRADFLARPGAVAPARLGHRRLHLAPLGATTAQTAALRTKQIDGMIVEVNAGYRLEEDGSGRVLVQFGDLIKTFHIYVLYAPQGFLQKNPAAVRAFLAGWFETIDWMQKNRSRTIDIVRRKTDVSLALPTRDYDELSGMFNQTGNSIPRRSRSCRAPSSRWAAAASRT